jgi:hypothetical protein
LLCILERRKDDFVLVSELAAPSCGAPVARLSSPHVTLLDRVPLVVDFFHACTVAMVDTLGKNNVNFYLIASLLIGYGR